MKRTQMMDVGYITKKEWSDSIFGACIGLSIMVMLLVFSGCATLPKDFDRPQSYAFTDTQDTVLGRTLAAEKAANSGKSGFHLLGKFRDIVDKLDQIYRHSPLNMRARRSHTETGAFGCAWDHVQSAFNFRIKIVTSKRKGFFV